MCNLLIFAKNPVFSSIYCCNLSFLYISAKSHVQNERYDKILSIVDHFYLEVNARAEL